jgi:adenylate cyclase, class 2
MSFEVEVKFRVGSHDDVLQRLTELGALAGSAVRQEDAYLAHPARDFAQTNEALRIRRSGDENRVTYKGPRRSGPTKTREEIEIAFTRGDTAFEQLSRLFANLGFKPVAVIRKSRQTFHLAHHGRDVEIVLDTADELGEFAEVEAIAATENDLPAVQTVVQEVAQTLGLTDVEPRSYLRMYLEKRAQATSVGDGSNRG